MKETISKGFESTKRSLKNVADDTAETAESLRELNQTMISSFNSVADSAKEMSEASSSLKKSVENFTPAVQTTLDNIQTKFVNSINASGQIMEHAGVDIRNAVEEMSKKTEEGQNSLNSSLSIFKKDLGDIMIQISRMTKDIGKQASASKDEMEKIRDEICNRLGSIASSNIMLKDVIDQIPLNKINEYIDLSLKNAMQSTDPRNKSTQSIALGHEKAGK
jgi:phage-related minor tail protein